MVSLDDIFLEVAENWGYETVQAIKKKITESQLVDRGVMKASVNYNVKSLDDITFSIIDYAKFTDEGTGIFGPNKTPLKVGYWKKLGWILIQNGWASRNNVNPWAVAKAIENKGGLKPRKFYKSVIDTRVNNGSLGKAIDSALKLYEQALADDFNKGQ